MSNSASTYFHRHSDSPNLSLLVSALSMVLTIASTLFAIGVGVLNPEIRSWLRIDELRSDEPHKSLIAVSWGTIPSTSLTVGAQIEGVIKAAAEKERAEREAKEAAERSAPWQVAAVWNRTNYDIDYDVLSEDGTWNRFRVSPGEGKTHWRKNIDIKVRYDSCVNGYLQQRTYSMNGATTIGRAPSQVEIDAAPGNYFWPDGRNGVVMYRY